MQRDPVETVQGLRRWKSLYRTQYDPDHIFMFREDE